ncbi:MAG: hypothetical protein N3F09_02175 [Bacteroidia bacterium]|nr:hypothetical protein [Bacteroidia bacterium]
MRELQIVSFDIPYPPDYGGVIDVYFKIKYLKEAGVDVILHAFDYKDKKEFDALKGLCKKIYLYKRKRGIKYFFHYLPYTVVTRINKELNENILKHGSPVLFEVLHTTGPLLDNRIRALKTFYRHSNIEHRYYLNLARDEYHVLKKLYYFTEAVKFYFYEKIIRKTCGIFAVNEKDAAYFREKYNLPVHYVPSFHPYNSITSRPGKGRYVLFHGNLSVNENIKSAEWILKHLVPSLPDIKFILAGKNPPESLKKKCNSFSNLELAINPDQEALQKLISDAHVNLVFSFNPEGLKLKMLYSFFAGRFVIFSASLTNEHRRKIITSSGLFPVFMDKPEDIKKLICGTIKEEFTLHHISSRKELLSEWDNQKNIHIFLNNLF